MATITKRNGRWQARVRRKGFPTQTKTFSQKIDAAVIPAEAIPNIGLAVILGVTAYELADACATMKDINSLNNLLSGAAEIDENLVCGLRPPSTEDIFKTLEDAPEQAWNTASSYEIEVPSWQRVKESGNSLWSQTVDLTTGFFKADDY